MHDSQSPYVPVRELRLTSDFSSVGLPWRERAARHQLPGPRGLARRTAAGTTTKCEPPSAARSLTTPQGPSQGLEVTLVRIACSDPGAATTPALLDLPTHLIRGHESPSVPAVRPAQVLVPGQLGSLRHTAGNLRCSCVGRPASADTQSIGLATFTWLTCVRTRVIILGKARF